MSANRFILLFVLLAPTVVGRAQNSSVRDAESWLGFVLEAQPGRHFGLWLDGRVSLHEGFGRSLYQALIRPGISYRFSQNVQAAAGYALVETFPQGDQNAQQEQRAWEQMRWTLPLHRSRFVQQVRLEERFRPVHRFNYRLRYNLSYAVALPRTHCWQLQWGDEIMFNFKSNASYAGLDQNRLYVNLIRQLPADGQLRFGYMFQYQLIGSGLTRQAHCLRLFYSKNFNKTA